MVHCWASRLDPCSSQQSREHLITESIWEGDGIEIVGLPWCKDEPKRVGLGSLTAKILCRSHNSRLSPLDQAAKDAFDGLRKGTVLGNDRAKLRPRKWKVRRTEILGLLLERWFLKTAINVAVTHPAGLTWELTGSPAEEPPDALVQIAYGAASFQEPMGLYCVADLGEDIEMSDALHFAPLLVKGQSIIGALFLFRGFRFLLHLDPRRLPDALNLPASASNDPRWRTGGLLYHLKEINFRIAKKRSHYVQFLWHVQSLTKDVGRRLA